VGQAAGWRAVYLVAGVGVAVLAIVLSRRLPGEQPRPRIAYGQLLASVVHLLRDEPLLRLRSAIGGLAFATFNVIWTSLAFVLAGPPYHYGDALIGLFGLLGAAGALAATFSGRLADLGYERWVSGGSLFAILGAMVLLGVGAHQLPALVIAIVVADLGIQAVHIQNQQLIFAIDPSARSRLNTGYMVTYFLGGAIGSATTGLAYGSGGWPAVAVLGIGYAAAALVLWSVSEITGIGHRQAAVARTGSAPTR
jgi:predicted MFS family arabinose efflux permease